jgi:formylglycine-generating enzyme required for sulfatase activity
VYFDEKLVNGSNEYYETVSQGGEVFVEDRNLTVPAFALAKFPVTAKVWKEVYDWATTKGYTFTGTLPTTNQTDYEMPVKNVTWINAAQWLNALSEKEELEPVYYTDANFTNVMRATFDTSTQYINAEQITVYKVGIYTDWTKNGYRLPCEVEWEFAARGGVPSLEADSTWMYKYPGTNDFSEYATKYGWVTNAVTPDGVTVTATTQVPVGLKAPNTAGLYDVIGNGFEWCGDISIEGFKKIDSDTPLRGPTRGDGSFDARGTYRIRRGLMPGNGKVTTIRGNNDQATNANGIGFRIARTGTREQLVRQAGN